MAKEKQLSKVVKLTDEDLEMLSGGAAWAGSEYRCNKCGDLMEERRYAGGIVFYRCLKCDEYYMPEKS